MNIDLRENRSFVFLQLIILASLIYFACFWRLGEKSITHYDEYVTMRAVQGIVDTGNLLTPTVDGEPYLRKPPFKMWLSLIPIRLLGQSNFSFRFIDALAGAGTALLVFFFSRRLIGLWGVGLLSSLALLGCKAFILEHCVRTAVHDSMLTFLSTAGIVCGWNYLQSLRTNDPHATARRWLYAAAFCVSCGILTKSIAGLFPVVVLGSFALCDKNTLRKLREQWRLLAITGLFTVLVPGLYFFYHFAFTDGAWGIMIKHEVVRRMESGFHHRDSPFFYVRGILVKNKFVPALLFILGMLWSSYQWFFKHERAHLLLLTWALLPVLLFSFIPSRLFWYLAPAVPGMAILVGSLCALFFRGLECATQEKIRSEVIRGVAVAAAAVLSLDGVMMLVENYALIILHINHHSETLPIDRFVGELLDLQQKDRAVRAGPLIVDRVPLSYADDVYLGMPGKNKIQVHQGESLEQIVDAHPTAVVVTGVKKAEELLAEQEFAAYGFLRAEAARPQSLAVLSKLAEVKPYPLVPLSQVFHFGKDDLQVLYGFAALRSEKKRLVRDVIGREAGFLLQGDRFIRDFGAKISINGSFHPEVDVKQSAIEISINNHVVGEFSPVRNSFKYFVFDISPQILLPGSNIVALRAKDPSIRADDRLLMLEKITLTLNASRHDD